MADDLPTELDLVVIGTGFPESCIAAAASRIGKTVLHLDRNDFYGGMWASFNLKNFIALLDHGNLNDEVKNCKYEWHIPNIPSFQDESEPKQSYIGLENITPTDTAQNSPKSLTQSDVLEQSRRFNLDLTPKILYSAGELVQLLITSNICRYGEFRAIDNVLTLIQDNLLNVPCSRADVFNSRNLSIVEKRLLMKVLNDCLVYGEDKHEEDELKNKGKTFREYLISQSVTEKISNCIMQAIAMCNDKTSFEVGMERTKRFLRSLGRYGNTPFLFPMYGCGEVPQCFCRLCAVFGGIYCLKSPISDIVVNADTNTVAISLENKKVIQAKNVVSSHGSLPMSLQERNTTISGHGTLVNNISRGIFICSSPLGDGILNSGGGGVNVLRLVSGQKEALVVQLSHFSGTCPKGYYLFHFTTPAETDEPSKDLQPFIAQIFNEKPNSPNLLFSSFFTITGRESNRKAEAIPIFCTAAPYYDLDYDRSIENAIEIFKTMYPESDFLPRAPDPEEIIIDGEDPRSISEVSLPDDLREQLQQLEQATGEMEIDGNREIDERMESD